MAEESVEVEFGLFDLNKEPPVERKRKRVEKNSNSTDKGNEGSDGLPKIGRILTSRTLAISDGEKQEIEMETVKVEDKDESEGPLMEYSENEETAPVLKKTKGKRGRPRKIESKRKRGRPRKIESKPEDKDESEGPLMEESENEETAPVLKKTKGKRGRPRKIVSKRKRGRPRKIESKPEVPSLIHRKKGKRGRPPKNAVKPESEDEKIDRKKVVKTSNGAGRGRGRPKGTGKRGRPRKTGTKDTDLAVKKKIVKKSSNGDSKKFGNVEFAKRLKTDMENGEMCRIVSKSGTYDSGKVVMRQKKATVERAKGNEVGLREQKQLLRDQIVEMITKAGWTVEYRQRLSKGYQDAVYVDRDRRSYWSVTLAYKKLKERVDNGTADERDASAFSPIPDEMFSMLFRITEKGKKSGKKKNSAVKTIKTRTKESLKVKSRLNRGGQRTLLARKRRDVLDSRDRALYEGNRNLIAWMLDFGSVPIGGKVKCRKGRGRKILLEGKVTKEGICCDCCDKTYGIQEFEAHAGGTIGKSFEDVYLDSGVSLFQCLNDAWKKHVKNDNIGFAHVDVEGDDPNDDTCNVCGDGGDLICCDSCPSTFHHGCLCIKVPSGDWHCVYCSCKFCGVACASASDNDDVDDDDSDSPSELFICRLCEQKFHALCIKGTIAEDFDHGNGPFCGKECFEISEQLQVLLGVKNELEEGFSYTVLHHVVSDNASPNGVSMVESNAKLAVTFSVMDECFEPIIDERSGTNMIHNVVYNCGSNIQRVNYEGFYTIILEKGHEVVAAASIRFHGKHLAEMPFIGTRFIYRRQGMCSRLLTSVEKVLCSLGIEKLVIPAISELNETWTNVFGFGPVEESTRQRMRNMSIIAFPGVDMLEKPLVAHPSIKDQIGFAVTESTEVQTQHQNTKDELIEENKDIDEPKAVTSSDIETQNNKKLSVVETDETIPADSSNNSDTETEAVHVNEEH
ncbi:hypothetical protein CASFOL_016721 [Castilleja foliolosa]|uniref:PHD-type domain-containing protein n=1 Tax=Castilleja foliolosa TaxID=1961234 RepID=A0ABD3DCE8_9LAMI